MPLPPEQSPPAPPGTWLAMALVLGTLFVFSLYPVGGWDTWWHMATGRMIVQEGTIPRTDPFSYVTEGTPWVNHQELSQIILYLVHAGAGPAGLILLRAVCVTLALFFLWLVLRARDVPLATSVTMILFLSLFLRSGVRPYLFSYLCFALMLWMLDGTWRRGLTWRSAVGLLLIQFLWANMHAESILGICLLGTYVLAAWIRAWSNRRAAPAAARHHALVWGGLGVLAIVVSCMTVHGSDTLLKTLVYTKRDPVVFATIGEWNRPRFLPFSADTLFFLSLPVMLAGILAGGRRDRRWPLLLLPFLFLSQALRYYRMVGYFYLACFCCIGALPRRRWLAPLAAVLQVLVCVFVMGVHFTHASENGLLQRSLAPIYPFRAVEEIQRLDLQGPMLNRFEWGGYLAWHLLPERRVFISGVMPPEYDKELFPDYLALRDPAETARVVDKYGFGYALFPRHHPIAVNLASLGWQTLFHDPDGIGDLLVPPGHPAAP